MLHEDTTQVHIRKNHYRAVATGGGIGGAAEAQDG